MRQLFFRRTLVFQSGKDVTLGKNSKESSDAAEGEVSFEEALANLEAVVHDLEEGQLGLEESLARYEQGGRYLRHCYRMLQNAERKIELLVGIDSDGIPIVEPLEDRELSLEEKATSRSRRRSRKSSQEAKNTVRGGHDPPALF